MVLRLRNISMETYLVQLVRDHLQQFLHYLIIGDVVTEGAKVGGERGDADAEVADGLPFIEGNVVQLRRSCCTLASLARSSPIRRFLTVSHASFSVVLAPSVL
jgi:hypothetical protein